MYYKRINRLATIQEPFVIVRAIERGVSGIGHAAGQARWGKPMTKQLRLAIPQVHVPAALEDHHDPGLFESIGAQLAQELGSFLPVSARDLKAASPDILGEDG